MKKIKKEDLIVNPKTVGNENVKSPLDPPEYETKVNECDTKLLGCENATYKTICVCESQVTCNSCGCNNTIDCYTAGNCIHTKSNTPVCCDDTQQGTNCQESVYVCVATSLAIDECTGTIPDSTGCDSPIESSDDTDCEGEGEEEDTDTFYC